MEPPHTVLRINTSRNHNLPPHTTAMSKAAAFLADPPTVDDGPSFQTILKHGHQDLVQAVAFNGHGDRCATGSVDGKIRVFNRHKDGSWRLCDTWGAHASEILEVLFTFILRILPGFLGVPTPH
jgi:WD40 repeat protein